MMICENFPTHQPSRSVEESSLSLWEQIREDGMAHEPDWTKPGFRTVAVQPFGLSPVKIVF
ncbi:hypothetical protein [Gloeothece verrucosa]|uniref:Uncharacterized protein n=1 Tax=Gloeothece verrucosa (strain PCC 7822) TaxID=497965 RepID=E0U5S8_GLOV7|nr:hypothetical protein [Gloeothece verrucosa]ADN15919.1 hypothetical protein Cyan7822_3994 [Gloeothece verrucosa PCC 7822]